MGKVDIFVRSLGQADLWSDVPLQDQAMGQVNFLSDLWVRLDLWSDVIPQDQASGQVDIFVRSDAKISLQVRLTF